MAQDYTAMDGPQMLATCGMDASKWAAAFCQHAARQGLTVDEGWMIGWFASAIMNTYDILTGQHVTVLPDGSAFFVADVPDQPLSVLDAER